MINSIINANAYLGTNKLAGKLDELELPAVKLKTQEVTALGIYGTTEIPCGLEKMEAKFKWNAIYADEWKKESPMQTTRVIVKSNMMVVDASGETEAIAKPCTEDAFLSQFIGKKGPFTADVVAGATFTSNAVINAVNSLFPAEEEAPAGNVIEAAAPGFDGEDVNVVVTLDENGAVIALTVDASTQTPGLGQKCAEDAFVGQFIGQVGPFALGEGIDVVSNATITSQAVIDAVNSVYPTQDMSVTEEAVAAPLAATVAAFGGQNITVTLTVDENGNVAALTVDASTQTPGLGLKCAEDEFVGQFIGQAGPFVLGENVDAVSYATITSDAVVKAVNELLGK